MSKDKNRKLRAAFLTDIHMGKVIRGKMGNKAPKLMEKFVKVANEFAPDFVADLGDKISYTDPAENLVYMKKLKDYFNQITATSHHVHGNHDFGIPRDDYEDIWQRPSSSYSVDINGYHLVFWNPNVDPWLPAGLKLKPKHLEWLKDDLANTDKPTILFSHVPLDSNPTDKLPEDHTLRRYNYEEASKIREVIENSGKVMLCMAGHKHDQRHREINGVHYVTQQSLVEQHHITGKPHGAYSFLEVEGNKITLLMKSLTKGHNGIIKYQFSVAHYAPKLVKAPPPPGDPQP